MVHCGISGPISITLSIILDNSSEIGCGIGGRKPARREKAALRFVDRTQRKSNFSAVSRLSPTEHGSSSVTLIVRHSRQRI
jgi:hypothetical protein